jgi:cytoskeletal protein RodZ
MNTTCTNTAKSDRAEEAAAHESTYGMLVREEEKQRSFLETVLYVLVVLSIIAAIWQFAHQPIPLPEDTKAEVTVAPLSVESTNS